MFKWLKKMFSSDEIVVAPKNTGGIVLVSEKHGANTSSPYSKYMSEEDEKEARRRRSDASFAPIIHDHSPSYSYSSGSGSCSGSSSDSSSGGGSCD